MPELVLPAAGKKVLVFSPHPDDETIALGGFISASRRNGADVRIVLITDGNRHHQSARRYAEFRQAASLLGVPESGLVFLGYPDGRLKSANQTSLRNDFVEQLRDFGPDIVLFPTPKDAHPDHATAGLLIEAILRSQVFQGQTYEYLVHYELLYPQPRKYAPGLYLLPPTELRAMDWRSVRLDAAAENAKMKAIFTYRSQLTDVFLRQLLVSSIRKNELVAATSTAGF